MIAAPLALRQGDRPVNPPDNLSPQQLTALLKFRGIDRPGQAVLFKPRNHAWRVTAADDVFFLKVYTKDWYRGDIAATAMMAYMARYSREALL
jgi:hypothetical protein